MQTAQSRSFSFAVLLSYVVLSHMVPVQTLLVQTLLLCPSSFSFTFPAAVQEERQRNKERDSEVESTSAVNEEMPVEKILEAEMAVEQKTELHADGTSGSSSVSCPAGDFVSVMLPEQKVGFLNHCLFDPLNLLPSAQRPCHKHLSGSRQAALHIGGVGQEDPSLLRATPG